MSIKANIVDTSTKTCPQKGKTRTRCISYVPKIRKWVHLKFENSINVIFKSF